MRTRTLLRIGLATLLCAGAALGISQEPVPPGLIRAGQTRERTDRMMKEDAVHPAPSAPEWKKAQQDADKLLELAQDIHAKVKASPDKIPAGLADELKQVEKPSSTGL